MIGMNQNGPAQGTIARQIEQYVVKHPGHTKGEIAKATGIKLNTVGMTLTRLRGVGLLCKRKEPGKAGCARWWPGMEDDYVPPEKEPRAVREEREGQPRRKVVKKWAPHLARDPLTAALFGPSIKQGG